MTSDQLVFVRQPDNADLSCRGMHRPTPLLNGLGHNDTGRSQLNPDLDGAPIAPRVTLPRRKYMTQVPDSELTFSLRVVCWD